MIQRVDLVSINTGPVALLGARHGREVYSAIVKHPVPAGQALWLGPDGLEGDHQADQRVIGGKRVHGGELKALYAYPSEHYPPWVAELGVALIPGDFGENLTVEGITEEQVVIGEVWAWGDALMEVTGPRRPCFKLNMLRGDGTAQAMMRNGRCGWYFRVLRPGGTVSSTDAIEVVHRPSGGVTIQDGFHRKVQDDPTVPDMPED